MIITELRQHHKAKLHFELHLKRQLIPALLNNNFHVGRQIWELNLFLMSMKW